MPLIHLQTTQISKYIFFESDCTVLNESIVFQENLTLNKNDLKTFIQEIIGIEQYVHRDFQKSENGQPLDFHGDVLKNQSGEAAPLELFHNYKNLIIENFFIGLNQYMFYGVGIDIHTGDKFKRIKKNGKEVIKATPRNDKGNIKNGNIEIKYKYHDEQQNVSKMIILNFHINFGNGKDVACFRKHFIATLQAWYGKEQNFVTNKKDYIKELENMNITNFAVASNETMLECFTNNIRATKSNRSQLKSYIRNSFKNLDRGDLGTYTLSEFYDDGGKSDKIKLTYNSRPKGPNCSNERKTVILWFQIIITDEQFHKLELSKETLSTQMNNQIQIFKVAEGSKNIFDMLVCYEKNNILRKKLETERTELCSLFDKMKIVESKNNITITCSEDTIVSVSDFKRKFPKCLIQ